MVTSNRFARRQRPLNSDMNVVPYIDVMLVLLVIFIVTAPMLATGIEVSLPKEQTKPSHKLTSYLSLSAFRQMAICMSAIKMPSMCQSRLTS